MNNDLISREALKKEIQHLGNANPSYWNKCDVVDRQDVLDEIDNAPTVEQKEFEQVLQPIKVNIPEDIKDKLIEEMSKPRKVILDESKTVQDCVIAYYDGFESARRLFERPHGEWKIDSIGIYCSECRKHSDYSSDFCPLCGADMRGEE